MAPTQCVQPRMRPHACLQETGANGLAACVQRASDSLSSCLRLIISSRLPASCSRLLTICLSSQLMSSSFSTVCNLQAACRSLRTVRAVFSFADMFPPCSSEGRAARGENVLAAFPHPASVTRYYAHMNSASLLVAHAHGYLHYDGRRP
eukprot:6192619-Pleurochrysis_carterae.AAC.2